MKRGIVRRRTDKPMTGVAGYFSGSRIWGCVSQLMGVKLFFCFHRGTLHILNYDKMADKGTLLFSRMGVNKLINKFRPHLHTVNHIHAYLPK